MRWRFTLGSGIGMAESRASVWGCSGAVWRRCRDLDDLRQINHGNTRTDVLDDRKVVGDEDVGEPELPLQVLESRLMICA
jgi:hypothetical protein